MKKQPPNLSQQDKEELNRKRIPTTLNPYLNKLAKSVIGMRLDINRVVVKNRNAVWHLYTNSESGSVYFLIKVKDDGIANVRIIQDHNYCQEEYEKCRIRPSVNNVVSLLLFCASFLMLILSLKNNSLKNAVVSSNVGAQFNGQFVLTLWCFAFIYMLHLLRIYLSTLMIENDSIFYLSNLIHLNSAKWKRFGELFIRLLIMLSVVSYVNLRVFFPSPIGAGVIKIFFGTYFSPFLFIFLFLLLWDIWMACLVSFPKAPSMRFWFLVNDSVGLFAVLLFVFLEANPQKVIKTIPFVLLVSIIGVLIAIGFASIIIDIVKNGKQYKKFIVHELKRWRRGIICGNACPPMASEK